MAADRKQEVLNGKRILKIRTMLAVRLNFDAQKDKAILVKVSNEHPKFIATVHLYDKDLFLVGTHDNNNNPKSIREFEAISHARSYYAKLGKKTPTLMYGDYMLNETKKTVSIVKNTGSYLVTLKNGERVRQGGSFVDGQIVFHAYEPDNGKTTKDKYVIIDRNQYLNFLEKDKALRWFSKKKFTTEQKIEIYRIYNAGNGR